MTVKRKTKQLWNKQFQRRPIRHKSHVASSGTETGPLRWRFSHIRVFQWIRHKREMLRQGSTQLTAMQLKWRESNLATKPDTTRHCSLCDINDACVLTERRFVLADMRSVHIWQIELHIGNLMSYKCLRVLLSVRGHYIINALFLPHANFPLYNNCIALISEYLLETGVLTVAKIWSCLSPERKVIKFKSS
jgi:hypothetical protein